MERRKILIIGMFDSIHLARWLSQFENEKIDFILFPSKKFKYVNYDLLKLITSQKLASYRFAKPYFVFKYIGFIDYFLVSSFKLVRLNLKLIFLRRITQKNIFTYVHAVELQGAAYLYDLLPERIQDRNSLIVTNYGSDIQYFKNFQNHYNKIKSVLAKADFYSAECHRDYELASKFGFAGKFLPCIPNAGGFQSDIFDLNVLTSAERNLIVAKCYGGTFGLGKLIIEVLENFLSDNLNVNILIHSITDDLLETSNKLKFAFPERVSVYKIRERIPRSKILDYLSRSRIYIGASKSDGISTSFLEALSLGAYPIQTDTSCAREWTDLGFFGSIISPNFFEMLGVLHSSYFDNNLEIKRLQNLDNAKRLLSFEVIQKQALKFYENI